jgi:nucleotide-binding universal stress UspA family protein
MKKILLAIDHTKGSEQAAQTVATWVKAFRPESIVLLHVQKLFGWSKVGEPLESDQDIEEISKALEGSERMEELKMMSEKIVSHFTTLLEQAGYRNIKAVVKTGHPAEQILATAKEEDVDLIVLGSRGARLHTILLGSVSREVTNNAEISVLVAR